MGSPISTYKVMLIKYIQGYYCLSKKIADDGELSIDKMNHMTISQLEEIARDFYKNNDMERAFWGGVAYALASAEFCNDEINAACSGVLYLWDLLGIEYDEDKE